MSDRTLTPKQQRFAEAYVRTGSPSAAYREAYDADNMSDKAVSVEAARLLGHPSVALAVTAIQAEAAARNDVTIDEITEMLWQAYETAERQGNASAMVSSCLALARLHGLLIEKRQTVNVTRSTADIDARIRELLAASDDGDVSKQAVDIGDCRMIPCVA